MRGYFDTNATAPLAPGVADVLHEGETKFWHNPSGLYPAAAAARQRLESRPRRIRRNARRRSGTARLFFGSDRGQQRRFSAPFATSWKSIHRPHGTPLRARCCEKMVPGAERVVEVDPEPGDFEDAAVVSVMAANNETGVEHDWRAIAAACKKAGVPYHCDAAQWVGKRDSSSLGDCDYVTVSGHKFGAARGIGALLLPAGETSFRWLAGGPQESGHRAGTENLAAALTLPVALDAAGERDPTPRDTFETAVEARVLGADSPRLWNTSMLLMPHTKNVKWLTRLAAKGFELSTGSACSAGAASPSHVMEAIGLDYEEMGRVLRVSSGWHTTPEDWQALATAFHEVAAEIKQRPPKANFLTP